MLKLFFSFFLILTCLCGRNEVERAMCRHNGFDPNVLNCKSCRLVKKYTQDEELTKMCKQCCNNFEHEKYLKARFEYDPNRITSELYSFIETYASRFNNLEIGEREGALCELYLFDHSKQVVDHFSIMEWDSLSLIQFLNDSLDKN